MRKSYDVYKARKIVGEKHFYVQQQNSNLNSQCHLASTLWSCYIFHSTVI